MLRAAVAAAALAASAAGFAPPNARLVAPTALRARSEPSKYPEWIAKEQHNRVRAVGEQLKREALGEAVGGTTRAMRKAALEKLVAANPLVAAGASSLLLGTWHATRKTGLVKQEEKLTLYSPAPDGAISIDEGMILGNVVAPAPTGRPPRRGLAKAVRGESAVWGEPGDGGEGGNATAAPRSSGLAGARAQASLKAATEQRDVMLLESLTRYLWGGISFRRVSETSTLKRTASIGFDTTFSEWRVLGLGFPSPVLGKRKSRDIDVRYLDSDVMVCQWNRGKRLVLHERRPPSASAASRGLAQVWWGLASVLRRVLGGTKDREEDTTGALLRALSRGRTGAQRGTARGVIVGDIEASTGPVDQAALNEPYYELSRDMLISQAKQTDTKFSMTDLLGGKIRARDQDGRLVDPDAE